MIIEIPWFPMVIKWQSTTKSTVFKYFLVIDDTTTTCLRRNIGMFIRSIGSKISFGFGWSYTVLNLTKKPNLQIWSLTTSTTNYVKVCRNTSNTSKYAEIRQNTSKNVKIRQICQNTSKHDEIKQNQVNCLINLPNKVTFRTSRQSSWSTS